MEHTIRGAFRSRAKPSGRLGDHISKNEQVVLPDVSIVIVNWNAGDLLRDCIRSIIEQTHRSFEIIVVDNASTDASNRMIRSEFPDIHLIENERNVGFAAGNNLGARIARGRYVLFLNPDTVILDGAIDKMVGWCDERPDVGCAGCQVLDSESSIQKTCFSEPGLLNFIFIETGLQRAFPNSKLFGRPEYSYWDRTTEKQVDIVSGMFLLIPRVVLEKVGLMDEAYFLYAEEADLCTRIRRAGLCCVFTPVARILHRDGGSKSTNQVKPEMYVQLQKSKIIYYQKFHGSPLVLLARSIFITSEFLRFALFGSLAPIFRNAEMGERARHARVALIFHIFGIQP